MPPHLPVFLGVAVIISITPGADMTLVGRNGLMHGRRAALLTVTGIGVGLVVWIAAAALGVAGLLRASATAFTVLKIAGGLYLIWLGVQTFLRRREDPGIQAAARSAPTAKTAFRQGLVSNLLNPKLAVFFTSLLPQFVDTHRAVLPQTLILAFMFAAVGLTWLVTYATMVSAVGGVLRRPRVRETLDAVCSAVLVALGVRLLFEKR